MPRQRKTRETAAAEPAVEAARGADGLASAAIDEEIPRAEAPEAAVPDRRATEDERAIDAPDAPAPETLPALIEALLFVSDGPVEVRTLARGLSTSTRAVTSALGELGARLEGRGLMLQTGPDGAQLVTVPEAAPYVQTFLGLEQNRRLSNAALEALAIVAYRQPVTRATIEAVRGVSSDGAIQTLRARGLIEEAGRAPAPGRPTLFVTTRRFLEHFGLQGPQDLPPLGDYELPPHDAPSPLPGLELEDAPAATAEEAAAGARTVEEVAEALASLSQAAQSLIDPARRRPEATALLLPGATRPALPAAGGLPVSSTSLPPASGAVLPQG